MYVCFPALTTSLEVLSTYHQRVSSLAEERRAYIDNLEALSPSVEEVKQEASRLDRTLAPFRTSYVELSEHAYSEELSSICLQLGDRTLIDRLLKDMLKSLESGDDAGAIVSSSEMQAEIEKAWMMDQLELLRSRECITEQVRYLPTDSSIDFNSQRHVDPNITRYAPFEADANASRRSCIPIRKEL